MGSIADENGVRKKCSEPNHESSAGKMGQNSGVLNIRYAHFSLIERIGGHNFHIRLICFL